MALQAFTTPAELTLADQKPRVLRFSNAALKIITAEFGISVLREGHAKLFEVIDEAKLSRLLVIGLDHKYPGGQPGIQEAEIDDILDAQNMLNALQQLILALGSSIVKNVLDAVEAGIAVVAAQKLAAEAATQKPDTPAPQTTVM